MGKVLSLPREVDYIHEPFNLRCGMPGMKRRYLYVRPTLDTEEMQAFHEKAKKIFTYDFQLQSSYHRRDSMSRKLVKKIIGTRGPFYLRLAKLNPFHTTALIKDPTAPYTAEYLYKHFNVLPVIVIRHPASFIASLQRINWWPKATDVITQPALWEDFLQDEAAFWEQDFSDQIDNAAAHWRLHFKILLEQARRYPDWKVVKLEDLSKDPMRSFREVYHDLDIPWSKSVEQKIAKMTQNKGKAEVSSANRVQDFNRDSAKIFELRRNSLEKDIRRRIFDICHDVALEFYDEASFALD